MYPKPSVYPKTQLQCISRSSDRRCSVKKDVLKNFIKFTGKHLCWGSFFNKVKGLRPECFSVNFVKFLLTPFLQNTYQRLLLHFVRNKRLALERTTVSQLEHNILFYSSYTGPKYWRVELEEVNSEVHYQLPFIAMFNLFTQ